MHGQPLHPRPLQTLTVVGAAVARLVGQTTSANSAHATVYVSARLDSPPLLPASLALRLSDPDAAEVVPPVLTWRPGEQATKQFALRLNKHVGVLAPGAVEGAAGVGDGGGGGRLDAGAGNGTAGGQQADGGGRNGTDAVLGSRGGSNGANSSSSSGGGGAGGAVGAGGPGGNDTDASGGSGGSRSAGNSSSSSGSNSTGGWGGGGGAGRLSAAVLYAEAVPLSNLLLQDGSDGGQARLVVSAPLPSFYVLGNQVGPGSGIGGVHSAANTLFSSRSWGLFTAGLLARACGIPLVPPVLSVYMIMLSLSVCAASRRCRPCTEVSLPSAALAWAWEWGPIRALGQGATLLPAGTAAAATTIPAMAALAVAVAALGFGARTQAAGAPWMCRCGAPAAARSHPCSTTRQCCCRPQVGRWNQGRVTALRVGLAAGNWIRADPVATAAYVLPGQVNKAHVPFDDRKSTVHTSYLQPARLCRGLLGPLLSLTRNADPNLQPTS